MESIVKIKLSTGKEIEVTLQELDELKKGLEDNTSLDPNKWYPYPFYPNPIYPCQPNSPWYWTTTVSPNVTATYKSETQDNK